MKLTDRDPAITALEMYLARLASSWYATPNEHTLKAYHAAYWRLRELGHTDEPDPDAQLPEEFMPKDKPETAVESDSD